MYGLKRGLVHAAHVYPRMSALALVATQRECASIVTLHQTDTAVTLHNVIWRMTSTQCQSPKGDYDRAAL